MKNIHHNIYNFLKDIESNPNLSLISLTVADAKNVLFDFKKPPYKKDGMQLVFSITKSVTSLAIGMLYDEGLITLDEPIIDYFKDELPSIYDPKIKDITIRHLLTMTSGITHENNIEMLKFDDYRTYFLSQKVEHKPGTYYKYHSATSHMLGAIVHKITKKTLKEYMDQKLFIPLGITNYHWADAKEGISFGGYGLSLDNDALIKIGQLLLNDGTYNGKRLISKAYLDMATKPQSIKQDYVKNPNTKAIGYQYGFQFHISPNGSYRADGAFGQIIVIYNGLAIISTAQYTDYEYLYQKIYDHFTDIHEGHFDSDVLHNYLKKLTFIQKNKGAFNIKQSFELKANPLKIKYVEFSNDYILLTYENEQIDKILYNFNQDSYGKSYFAKDLYMIKQPHWVIPQVKKDELSLKILYVETPFFAEYNFKFNKNNVTLEFKPSPNFLLNGFTVGSKSEHKKM